MSEYAAAWMRWVSCNAPAEPIVREVELEYGDDQPAGDGWLPLYRKPPIRRLASAKDLRALLQRACNFITSNYFEGDLPAFDKPDALVKEMHDVLDGDDTAAASGRDAELIDRVCRCVGSTQEGRKLREYIEDLETRVSFAADALTVVERRRDELRDRLRAITAVNSRQKFMYCPATSLLKCELRDCIDKGCALVIDGSCSRRVLFAETLVKARELNAELRRAADSDNTKEPTT